MSGGCVSARPRTPIPMSAGIDAILMNVAARLPLLFLGMLSLLVGVLAGLARLSVTLPAFATAQVGGHGALMISAFLGTVISLERAVALGRRWPYLAPLSAGLGGLAMIAGFPLPLTQALSLVAGVILSAGSLLILRQQMALYTATLALGAICWLIGSLTWCIGGSLFFAVPWWMAFLVLTIAGERLELTRFLPTTPTVQKLFALIVAAMLSGLVSAFWQAVYGLMLVAAALVALAAWLLRNDIARRTIRQSGLTRFIACCLLCGYAWLVAGGVLGLAGGFGIGSPLRDAALHAIFLGFVFSMILGHAPIIFPAVAKVKIPYHPAFYLPLAALHVSLFARVVATLADMPTLRQYAAIANAAALAIFILTLLLSVLRSKT